MNINQLKYVIEVAASSSMREAATKLFVTQPALSESIRELEDELGILIFERTNKGISVTEAGREFLNYAKSAVGQYEILEERYLSRDSGKEHFSVMKKNSTFINTGRVRFCQIAVQAVTDINHRQDKRRMAVQPAFHIIHPAQLIARVTEGDHKLLLCLMIRFLMQTADRHGTAETDTGRGICFPHSGRTLKTE